MILKGLPTAVTLFKKDMGIMDKRRKIKATAAYSLVQIGTWAYYAVILSFAGNYLKEHGFTDSGVGLLLGAAAAVSFVLQILFAELVSRLKRLTMYTVGIASAVVMAACSAAVLSDMTVLAIGCYFIACSLLQALPGIGNTIGMEAIEGGSPTAYSVARGIGSLGYSIFAYVTGLLVASMGIRMVSYLGLVVSAIMLAGLFLYSSEIRTGSAASVTKEARSGGFFRQNKAFFIFLIGAVFLCINHNLITCFLYRIMLFKQGTAADQGLAAGISAIVEVPIMFLFPYITKRIPCKALVCFSGLWFAVKSLCCFIVSTPGGMFVASALQIFSWGLYSIAAVDHVSKLVPAGETVRAQSYLASAAPIGGFISMLCGGFILDSLGVQALLLISTVCGLIGAAFILVSVIKKDRGKDSNCLNAN